MSGPSMLGVTVWGDFACFTRPELKVERVSYPVMTPSAARGVLEAIFWRPEFSWRVREIWVLRPIRYVSLVRNEINSRQSAQAASGWGPRDGYHADEDRAQRHTLALRDVAYTIWAEMHLRPHATDPPAKYRDQFRRRVERGQAFQQPYLGCREFVGCFGPPDPAERPVPLDLDLGLMLFDLRYQREDSGPIRFAVHGADGRRWVTGTAAPCFFRARLEHGVLRIPPELYEDEEGAVGDAP